MRNMRGEGATVLIILIAGAFLLLGPKIPDLSKIFTGEKPQQKASWSNETVTHTPIILRKDDDAVLATKTEHTFNSGTDERPVKLTVADRVVRFFEGLGWWAILFIVISLLLGGWPIVMLINGYRAMKSALKNTISGIRKVSDTTVICRKCGDTVVVDSYATVVASLDAKQDKKDKVLIDKLKSELH